MPTESLFKSAAECHRLIIEFDGHPLSVPGDVSLAAALLVSGIRTTRTTVVTGQPRAPYCLMGVCFECLVEIDGIPNCQACMITVREGMRVRSQHGAPALACAAGIESGHHEA
ncbi:(2Fe-2S)-binding protein [Pseudomonas fluorescens]|uniref:(2Fe-2S)-binding protein n=1 Tax=Pseudomonas fluorescens TaxID=294 RepID=UPI00125B1437|nr:(2Fe-2S)-binding protein [Pseudomonas fluorescens]VVN69716.1 hypothetical protein PS720_00343 [Pseudomonas fluorescens]